jgi:hypothetical protein
VGERAGTRRTLDRLDRNVLHLLLGFVELTLQRRELFGLTRNNLFQGLDSQFRHAPIRLRVFGRDEKPLLVLLRGLSACLPNRALDFLREPLGERIGVLSQLRDLFLPRLQDRLDSLTTL